jgi:hypothetical protein
VFQGCVGKDGGGGKGTSGPVIQKGGGREEHVALPAQNPHP